MWKEKRNLKTFHNFGLHIFKQVFEDKRNTAFNCNKCNIISYSPISIYILQKEEKTSGNRYARKSYMLCGKRENVSYIQKSHSIINPIEVFTPYTD